MSTEQKEHQRYFGQWHGVADVLESFEAGQEPIQDEHIIYAAYDHECYEGSAMVLFQKDGTLYEVSGSHCSCYGLEGKWQPEPVTWDQLAMRNVEDERLAAIINRHCPRA
jgi:hypothetical protein